MSKPTQIKLLSPVLLATLLAGVDPAAAQTERSLTPIGAVSPMPLQPQCLTPADCDDADPCTAATCDNGVCVHTPIAGCCTMSNQCDDQDVCTTDSCVNNACVHTPIAGCCNAAADCDDNDPCTIDSCMGNACEHRIADMDGNGVPDCQEQHQTLPAAGTIDSASRSCSELDDDQDGVDNCSDACPDTPQGELVDVVGCTLPPIDDAVPCIPFQHPTVDFLASALWLAPVCGSGCPIYILGVVCGLMTARNGFRKRRR